MQIFDLLLRDLDLFEDGGDSRRTFKKPFFPWPHLDEARELLDVGQRVLDRQHSVAPIPAPPRFRMAPRQPQAATANLASPPVPERGSGVRWRAA